MRLSEAIRLGAMLHPQEFGAYKSDTGTCALGAAIEAAIGRVRISPSPYFLLLERWPWINGELLVVCPAMCQIDMLVGSMIIHLNDDHRWPREQIADWVATIEAESSADAAAAVVAARTGA